jgi:hypothetical protein
LDRTSMTIEIQHGVQWASHPLEADSLCSGELGPIQVCLQSIYDLG